MSAEYTLLFMILFFYTVFLFTLAGLVATVQKYLAIRKIQKQYESEIAKRKQMIKEMKDRGEFHEWIVVQSPGKDGKIYDYHLCKKTGYCAETQQFYQMSYVQEQDLKQRYTKEYDAYREKQIKLLSEKYNHTLVEMESIVNDVFDIKKQFALKWMKEKNEK